MVLITHIFSRPQTTLLSRMIRYPRVLHFKFTVLYRLNIYRYLLEGGIYIVINLRHKSSINVAYAFSVIRGDSCPSLREIERGMNNLFQRHICNYSFTDCLFHLFPFCSALGLKCLSTLVHALGEMFKWFTRCIVLCQIRQSWNIACSQSQDCQLW